MDRVRRYGYAQNVQRSGSSPIRTAVTSAEDGCAQVPRCMPECAGRARLRAGKAGVRFCNLHVLVNPFPFPGCRWYRSGQSAPACVRGHTGDIPAAFDPTFPDRGRDAAPASSCGRRKRHRKQIRGTQNTARPQVAYCLADPHPPVFLVTPDPIRYTPGLPAPPPPRPPPLPRHHSRARRWTHPAPLSTAGPTGVEPRLASVHMCGGVQDGITTGVAEVGSSGACCRGKTGQLAGWVQHSTKAEACVV